MSRLQEGIIDRGNIERTRGRSSRVSGLWKQEAAAAVQPIYRSHGKKELASCFQFQNNSGDVGFSEQASL